jgi:antitoxin (DNA-binding transcriptional repressor) of toxin-antitoxin stability system
METTLEYAEAHFPQLMRQVKGGEEISLREGAVTVAKIIPVGVPRVVARPKVGEMTSAPVRWSEGSFAALDDDGMKALNLL